MKLHSSFIAIAVMLASANMAQAQMTTLNTLGRYLGWGVSDGYHANRACGGGCAGCGACGGAVYGMPAQPPIALPIQHAPIGQPVPAMQPWQPAPPAAQQYLPASSPSVHPHGVRLLVHPGAVHAAPGVVPHGAVPYGGGRPNNFVPPYTVQPQPLRRPARPAYIPVSLW